MITHIIDSLGANIVVNPIYDVVIIGGGQAGLVQGYYLQQQNLNFVILDANPEIGGSWHHYWDSLTLFSAAPYASLDGLPFPGNDDAYPNRQDVINYLQHYTKKFDLPVISKTKVTTVHKQNEQGRFAVLTTDGRCYQAKSVIAATGAFTKPHIPHFDGQATFNGQQRHSYHYHNPNPYHGQRIVVIGSHNSAVQIACELAHVADVSLAVRDEIQFAPQHILGKDIFFFLHDTGYDMLPIGCHFGLCDSSAVYDDGQYQTMIEAGNPDTRPMFTHITENGVIWSDGSHEHIDTLLYATGFQRNNKPYLAQLGALDDSGLPIEHKGVSQTVDGLFYIGLDGQIAPASATLRGVSRDARYIANKVYTYLDTTPMPAI